jgi:hypothetical protein
VGYIDITNPIVVAVAITVAAGIPALLPRLPVPGMVLEIVIGAFVGPQVRLSGARSRQLEHVGDATVQQEESK